MPALDVFWQEVIVFAVLAVATGFLVIRAWRTATRQHGTSCGACPGNPEKRAANDRCAGRPRRHSRHPPPLS